MLELDQVSKVYRAGARRVCALDAVGLRVAAGEFVAVQGPSGSGKSTLLAIVAGLTRPTVGQVRVDGRDLVALGGAGRARFRAEAVGFVFQLFHLLPYLTVLENVLLPNVAGGAPGERGAASALLTELGLGERADHRPAELSVGERQRAALARALLRRPRLILADEPTGNLDPDNAALVLDRLQAYQRAGGTLLLVTHDPAAAARAGRVLRLVAGRLDTGAAA